MDDLSNCTLRFTEWKCGHHGQRPEDIAGVTPVQAKAILWAVACAISQPGHARAMLFGERKGWADIYVTDDYCEFKPEREPSYRPEVVLCADQAQVDAILAAELRGAREEMVDPDLYSARQWDGKDIPEALVEVNQAVLTLLTREQVEKLAEVDDTSLDPKPPLFELPPMFFDGAQVLERLRQITRDNEEWCARVAAERAEEERLDPTTDNHEADTE